MGVIRREAYVILYKRNHFMQVGNFKQFLFLEHYNKKKIKYLSILLSKIFILLIKSIFMLYCMFVTVFTTPLRAIFTFHFNS